VFFGAQILTVQIQEPHPPRGMSSGLLGIMVLVVGLVLITYGGVITARRRRWRQSAAPVEGHVVDNLPQASRRGRTMWLPLIEFEADGATVRFPSAAAASAGGWPLGHAVDVLYDPRDPHHAGVAESGWPISLALVAGVAVWGVALAVVV